MLLILSMNRISLYKKIVVCFIIISVAAVPGAAEDIYDILINDDNSVSDQYHPRLGVDSDGMVTIIWTDIRNGQSDIYYQSLDTAGTFFHNNRKINNDQNDAVQQEPALAARSAGEFIAVWKDYRDGSYPFGPGIYAANADSADVGANTHVSTSLSEVICETPDVAVLSDGSAVVVWADYRNNNWDIFGRRLSSEGAFIGDDFRINIDGTTGQQHAPRIAAFDGGGFVVVWYDNRMGNDDIFFQRFDSSAAPIGGNTNAGDDLSAARQILPDVAADGRGRFFIAWIDWRNGVYPNNPDIYMRRFDSSGTPLASSTKINGNDNSRAQRDVAICSDRMGNLCVVWADSVSGQWDVMAQLIDRDGLKSDGNFAVHEETAGKQLQPDIATDDYKILFTWADYRSGNFDIYATVMEFNAHALTAEPSSLSFTMEEGGSLPGAQTISLTKYGLNELNWTAFAEDDWLSVSPVSGVTPADIQIDVTTDTLTYGTYTGGVRFVNDYYDDSSLVVDVTLNVTAPLLDISPDTLNYRLLKKLGDPDLRTVAINNSGSGILSWNASENVSWMSLDKSSGTQAETLLVDITVGNLEIGDNTAPIVFTSSDAANSPETVWVDVELFDNMSYIDPAPDSFAFDAVTGDTLTGQVEIKNPGDDHLAWTAVPADEWVEMDRTTGSDGDKINITIETISLTTGYYYTGIIIYDSASFNVEEFLPIEIFLSSGDTVQFINSPVVPNQIGLMPVYLTLISPTKGGYIPFGYDGATAVLDSMIINDHNLPDFVDYAVSIGTDSTGELGFRINDSMLADSVIPSGEYHIADLFFTAGESEVFNMVDTLSSDSSSVYILNEAMEKVVPALVPGDLIIGNPTAVEEDDAPFLPEKISLEQNYPNPFNSSTVIEFSLPRAGETVINIYNILGQDVCCLREGYLSVGEYKVIWDGRMDNGLAAPSGIYFYRLVSGGATEVKKMVLVK